MMANDRKRLEKILKSLDEARALVRDLLGEQSMTPGQEVQRILDVPSFLESLRGLERKVAEERLLRLKQHELGAIYVGGGGPSTDRKKPKVWLVEQILWSVFDFERGHETIRNQGNRGS